MTSPLRMDAESDDQVSDLPPISVDQLTNGMASVVTPLPMDSVSSTSSYCNNASQVNTPPADYSQSLLDMGSYSDGIHKEPLTSVSSFSLQPQVAAPGSYSHTLPQPAHPCPYPPSLPPAYMFPPFDYTSRPLLPPLPPDGTGHTGEPTFLGYQPPDARSYPPPFPGPFPYGLPPFTTDKTLPHLATYPPAEVEREHQDEVPPCTSIGTRPPILPPLQAMPPFPLLPPPPGQYFSGGYPPPPPAHSQSVILPPNDLPPCEELVKRHLDVIPLVPNTDSNPASPAPSAMLSPNTSKLLQSAIESDAESIMALSPGTEPIPSPIKVDRASEFQSTDIVAREEQAFSQYEVEIQKLRRVSPSDTTGSEQTGSENKVAVFRYEDESMDHLQLPSCQFDARSSAVQTDDVDSEVSEEESETDDSEELDEEDDAEVDDEAELDEDQVSEDDEEVSENGEEDPVTKERTGSCGSNRLGSELDFSEEIPRVESPFNRIRPSLLKSYRASKRYKDKKKMKKSKMLDILSPLSPYDVQRTQKKRLQMKDKASETKLAASELESEVASSSEDISETDGLPKTPFSVLSEKPETPSSSTVGSSARVSPIPQEEKFSMASTPQGTGDRDFSPGLSPSSSEVPTPQPAPDFTHPLTPRTGLSGRMSAGMENYTEDGTQIQEGKAMDSHTLPYCAYTSEGRLRKNFHINDFSTEEKEGSCSVEEKLHRFGMCQRELSTQKSEGFDYGLSPVESPKSPEDKHYAHFYSSETITSIANKTCEGESHKGVKKMDEAEEKDYMEDKEGLHLMQEIQLYEQHLQSVVNGGDGISQEEEENNITEEIVQLNDKHIVDIRPIAKSGNHSNVDKLKVWSVIPRTTSGELLQPTESVSSVSSVLDKASQKPLGYYSCESDEIPSESESSVYEHSDSCDATLSDDTFKKPSIESYLRAVGRVKTENQKPGTKSFNVPNNVTAFKTETTAATVAISLPNFGSSFGRPSQLTCLYSTNFLQPVKSTSVGIPAADTKGLCSMSDNLQSEILLQSETKQKEAYVSCSMVSHIPNESDHHTNTTSMQVIPGLDNITATDKMSTAFSINEDDVCSMEKTDTNKSNYKDFSVKVAEITSSKSAEADTVTVSSHTSQVLMASPLYQSVISPAVTCTAKSLFETSSIVQTVNSADYSLQIPSENCSHVGSTAQMMIPPNHSSQSSCALNLPEQMSFAKQSSNISVSEKEPSSVPVTDEVLAATTCVGQTVSSSVDTYRSAADTGKQLIVPLPKITTGLCAIVVQPLDSLGKEPQQKPMVITAMKKGGKIVVNNMASISSITEPLAKAVNSLVVKKPLISKHDFDSCQKVIGKYQPRPKVSRQKQILPKPKANEVTLVNKTLQSSDQDVAVKIKNNNVCLDQPLLDGPPISQGFYCVECNKMYPAGCSLHEQQYTCIHDSNPTKARISVPPELCLRAMYNQNSPDFMGVICRSLIPAKTKFGPLQGIRMTKQELENPQNTAYVWEIFDEENPNLVLDCRDENHSNWLMFVKRARSSREQNLMVYQESLHIYFITIRDIGAGEELLYWYGRDYAVMLGLCIKPEDFFKCQKCHRQFPDKNSLQTHMKAAHPNLDTYTNRCEHCGKVFRIPSILKKHVRAIHERIKSYECDVCSKAFSDLNNFRRHKKLHTDSARQFECVDCGRRFTQKHHLTDHMTIHSGERNYPCRFCDKRFSRRQDVRSHEKTVHIVDTEFKCIKCDQIFYSKKYYNSHMKTHEPRQFHCHLCEKQFTQKVHLKAHLVAKHRTGIDSWEKTVNYKPKCGSRVT